MLEESSISPESRPNYLSVFERNLYSEIEWWQANKAHQIKGAEDGCGRYELGFSVESILTLIKEAGESGKPTALILLGNSTSWNTGKLGEKIIKSLPPLGQIKGFDPVVIENLMTKLNLFPRTSPDRVIFSDPIEGINQYPNPEGMEDKIIYNILSLDSPLVPKNTYWHELVRGYAYVGYSGSALVTVNKSYLPMNTNNTFINRVRRRLQRL